MSAQSVVGVDVAKRTFDMFMIGSSKPTTYRNSKQGITDFIKSLRLLVAPFVVMEATGSYQRDLARRLAAAGITYSVVNPRTIRHFAKAGNFLAKTDRLDARGIASTARRWRHGSPFRPLRRPYGSKRSWLAGGYWSISSALTRSDSRPSSPSSAERSRRRSR